MANLNQTPEIIETEIWKDVHGYEGIYQVSSIGRVKSISRTIFRPLIGKCILKEKILTPSFREGYPFVRLSRDGEIKSHNIHRLVGQAFIQNPDNLECINHINSNRSDNRVENLEWCTYSHNNKHAYSNGNQVPLRLNKGRIGVLAKNSKPVIQLDLNGLFIKEYASAAEASRETGISFSLISGVCRGKNKKTGGFRWYFKDDLDNYEHWQLKNKMSILPTPEATPEGDLFESGIEELNRLAEWTNAQAEQQLYEQERS